jgi:hypothetical protein
VTTHSSSPKQESPPSAQEPTQGSEMVVVGIENFDAGTFSFPAHNNAPFPYITITDPQHGVIRFSILRS